jgi:flagellar hook protein FlgE
VGTPATKGFGATIAGELEMSNVDLASEMTSMITAERGYQANSRVITTADEMLSAAVSMVQ